MRTIRGRHFVSTGRVLGIAHRGASRYAPENTLAAFRLAVEHGAPAVECDVRRTQDGHLVVMHDLTVDRTTDGRGAVSDYALQDLRRLDAGRWFGPSFSGERIPLLEEVLATIRGRALIQLEVKNGPTFYEGIEQQILEAVKLQGMEEETLVMSFDHQSLGKIRALSSQLTTGISYGARLVDAAAAAQAHAASLGFFVWTVDDEAVLRRCLSYGVDGIASNDTKLLGRLLNW